MAMPKPPKMTAGASTIQLSEKKVKPMAAKKKLSAVPPKNRLTVNVPVEKGEGVDRAIGRTYLSPEVNAGLNMSAWNGGLSVDGIRAALTEEIEKVGKGDMGRPEAMLLSQAHMLDSLFNVLAAKAQNQTYIPNLETFLRLALKAQSQCRCTLEALSNIKNPTIFSKQTNINNHGNQQINNSLPASRAEENKKLQNELLVEAQNGGTALDIKATGETVPVNSRLEAVDKSRS